MKILRMAVALLPALSGGSFLAQQPVVAKEQAPLIADVHASAYRPSITYTVNISHQRFDMRNATIVDMIDFVRGQPDDDGREDNAVAGGPTWIDFNRFDIAAIIPSVKPASSSDRRPSYGISRADADDRIRPVVGRILAERFHLRYHTEDRPLPGYVMTVGKGGAKLTEAKDPEAPNNCQGGPDGSEPGQVLITCTSETMAEFLATIGGNFRHPILDRTGFTGRYDFRLRFSSEQLRTREDSIHAYIDVIGKQLGLTIAAGDVAQPAIVVDGVDSAPTPNAADIARLVPALPELEFEVASIRPAADDAAQDQIRPTGSQIVLSGFNMQGLLTRAFNLPTGAMLGDALPTLSQQRYTILVKLPADVDARAIFEDQDQLDNMLQKLLIDRFQIKYHWGEQTREGYVLLAGTPKMKKADPGSRSFCKYGPPEGEKDVRTANSPFDGEFHCQNVSMAQFAELAQSMAKSEIKDRVPDKTGLAGAYDFTLYYTTGHRMRVDAAAARAAARQAGDTASLSEPVAGLSVEEAFRKELGLKLEKQSGLYPALVLDHIERTPTEN